MKITKGEETRHYTTEVVYVVMGRDEAKNIYNVLTCAGKTFKWCEHPEHLGGAVGKFINKLKEVIYDN